MEIILWRHAEAEDAAHATGASADAARPLTKHGHKQAKKMAAWLGARLSADCRMLVSPAVRAQQTAAALDRRFDTSPALAVGAAPKAVLAAARWPDGPGTVLIVGHQPTLGRAAALALWGRDEDWNLKKGAMVWIAQRSGNVDGGGRQDCVLRAALSPDLL